MSPVNTRVVRRSAALQRGTYGMRPLPNKLHEWHSCRVTLIVTLMSATFADVLPVAQMLPLLPPCLPPTLALKPLCDYCSPQSHIANATAGCMLPTEDILLVQTAPFTTKLLVQTAHFHTTWSCNITSLQPLQDLYSS